MQRNEEEKKDNYEFKNIKPVSKIKMQSNMLCDTVSTISL